MGARTVDLLIIGGGINGAGIARDAAGRGLTTLLVEQADLGGATSASSSKLIHGGLRYLEQFLEPGCKLKDARAAISWRKSEAVSCWADPQMLPPDFQRVKVEADLSAIKAALKDGQDVPGAELQTKQNIQIK